MTLSSEDYNRWRALVKNSRSEIALEVLTEKDENFLEDTGERLKKYRRATRISEAQHNWLCNIEDKVRYEMGDAYDDDDIDY